MESKTIALVQESFEKVKPIAPAAAEIFYNKLFELDPQLKPLFPNSEGEMKEQRNKLMSMLGAAVAGLSNLDALIPILKNLGKRHVDYKVEAFHYVTVGEALIGALEVGLGDDFTQDVKEAWANVYGVISNVMIEGAYQDIKM
ncbi:hemin receptor [Flavivirga aquatica]|uniref:Hemin receptor n=1 Tax=Flavivirga aquatica TaxID=1849968 RepID=A0A1E5TA13_9FLAO|nr:globin family protein [Flavivirga aquatica]OEK08188.1 hemin receptor [Flavivirga aquatica]